MTFAILSELVLKINPEKSFLGKLEINFLRILLAITVMKFPECNQECCNVAILQSNNLKGPPRVNFPNLLPYNVIFFR